MGGSDNNNYRTRKQGRENLGPSTVGGTFTLCICTFLFKSISYNCAVKIKYQPDVFFSSTMILSFRSTASEKGQNSATLESAIALRLLLDRICTFRWFHQTFYLKVEKF